MKRVLWDENMVGFGIHRLMSNRLLLLNRLGGVEVSTIVDDDDDDVGWDQRRGEVELLEYMSEREREVNVK